MRGPDEKLDALGAHVLRLQQRVFLTNVGADDHRATLHREMAGVADGPRFEHDSTMKLLRDVAISHLLTIEPHDSLRQAARAMTDRGVGSAVVMLNGEVAGIVTERDVLHAVADGADLGATTVEEIMTRDPVAGSPGWEITKAVRTMTSGGFRHLLVQEMDVPIGIVSLRDLMDAMADLVQERSAASD